jgi:hypothetical protein
LSWAQEYVRRSKRRGKGQGGRERGLWAKRADEILSQEWPSHGKIRQNPSSSFPRNLGPRCSWPAATMAQRAPVRNPHSWLPSRTLAATSPQTGISGTHIESSSRIKVSMYSEDYTTIHNMCYSKRVFDLDHKQSSYGIERETVVDIAEMTRNAFNATMPSES